MIRNSLFDIRYFFFYKLNQAGFTLLEVIVVLILSLLILGLVMVSFTGLLASSKLQATVREFSASLRQARDLAKIHGEPQVWTLDMETREYGVEGYKTRKIPSNLEFKVIDSNDGEVLNGKYRLVFQPNGGIEGPSFLFSYRKKVFGVDLDPLVGSVVTKG